MHRAIDPPCDFKEIACCFGLALRGVAPVGVAL